MALHQNQWSQLKWPNVLGPLISIPNRSIADQFEPQRDLSALERRGDAWSMRFNASKCLIMQVHRSRSPLQHYYTLCNRILSCVDEAISRRHHIIWTYSWSGHISSISNRANVSLGFLRRNLKCCPHKLKETAYFALVCSVLDYAYPIWDPFLRKDVDMEKVQWKAACFVWGDYHTTSSVTAMLSTLGWNQLEKRRWDVRLALLFKVVHGHVEVTTDQWPVPVQGGFPD